MFVPASLHYNDDLTEHPQKVFLSGALTVASPDIGEQLNFKQADIQWPLNAFAFVLLGYAT